MQTLLINEPPLQVLPSLAKKLNSVDKAIILQQMHYWLMKSTNVKEGHRWIYNSATKWHEQFPWLSEKTIQRYLKDLEKKKILITGNYNKAKFDRTKWYRIDYDALDNLGSALGLTVPTIGTDNPNGMGLGVPTNTNRLPETTTETNNNTSDNKSDHIQYKQIIDYLNEKAGKHFRNVESNKKLIRARWHEGYRLDDFKKVIDNKVLDANDANSFFTDKYLQPSTLFGNKFDQYLNQQIKPNVEKGTQSYGGVEF